MLRRPPRSKRTGTLFPYTTLFRAASARDMKLLPVTNSGLAAMKKINAGYNKVIVPGGTYPKQDKDLPVIGYSTHFIVSCKLPADKVYAETKMMATHSADMDAVNKEMTPLTAKAMAEQNGVPVHRGDRKRGG